MLSQLTQVTIILILAMVYIRSPALAQNDTTSSNTSSTDANTTTNGTLGNGAGSVSPVAHTVILLSIGSAASLLNTMVIH